jgi:hypothetical protein
MMSQHNVNDSKVKKQNRTAMRNVSDLSMKGHKFKLHARNKKNREHAVKVIPQFCIAHFYCAHLITYTFIHYAYRLKKNHFMTILCYFKTSLVTFVQRITLKSMFSKKAYKSVAIGFPVSVVYLFTCISRFNATIP